MNAGSGTYNTLDKRTNASCLFHTGGSSAGGQGCIVFKQEDQNELNQLLTSSKGGTFNMLVLDGSSSLNTVA